MMASSSHDDEQTCQNCSQLSQTGVPELPKSAFSPFSFIAVQSNSKPQSVPGWQIDGAWVLWGKHQ